MQYETVWLCLVKTPASLQSNSLHLASGSFGIAVHIFRMPLKRNLNLGLVRYYLRSVVTSLLSVCELSRYVNGLQECFFHPQCRPIQHQNTKRQSWETNTTQTAVPTPKKSPIIILFALQKISESGHHVKTWSKNLQPKNIREVREVSGF